jgi:hypothetical protein
MDQAAFSGKLRRALTTTREAMSSNSQIPARLKRRRQLEKQMEELDLSFPNKIKRIVSCPIATAEAVLSLPPPGPSPILCGTCAKRLSKAIASVPGYRNVPTRTMRGLIKKLNRRVSYPYAELPPKTYDEELVELVDDMIRKIFPHLRHHECTPIARRLLALITKESPIIPDYLKGKHPGEVRS